MKDSISFLTFIAILGGAAGEALSAPSFQRLWSKKYGSGCENGEISPDGKTVALGIEEGSSQGFIYLVDPANGNLKKKLPFVSSCSGSKCNEVESMAWSGDSRFIAAGGNNQPVKIFNVATGEVVFSKKTSETDGMRGHPSGKFFAISNKGAIFLVSVPDFKEIGSYSAHSCGINTVDFTPDGKFMVSGACDKKWMLWEVNGTTLTKKGSYSAPNSVKTARITPDGKHVVTACGDANEVTIFTSSGSRVAGVDLNKYINSSDKYVDHAELSPDGKHMITQGKGRDILTFTMPDAKFISRTPSAGNGEYMHWKGNRLLIVSSDGTVNYFSVSGTSNPTTGVMAEIGRTPGNERASTLRIGGEFSLETETYDLKGSRLVRSGVKAFLPMVVEPSR